MTESATAFPLEKPDSPNRPLWPWLAALLPPGFLSLLFLYLKDNTTAMDFWVHRCMAPVMQGVGKFWSILPFSVAEVMIAIAIAALILWPVRSVILLVKQRRVRDFFRRVLAVPLSSLAPT